MLYKWVLWNYLGLRQTHQEGQGSGPREHMVEKRTEFVCIALSKMLQQWEVVEDPETTFLGYIIYNLITL